MTIIDAVQRPQRSASRRSVTQRPQRSASQPARRSLSQRRQRSGRQGPRTSASRRSAERVQSSPRPGRPAAGVLTYRGSAVPMSRAPHRARSVSVATTVAIAGLSALVTLWLGVLGQDRAAGPGSVTPEQLAVVQIQAGENLQQVARRMAPDLPVAQTVARIRELNGLDSAAVDAGQTLIAPVR